MIAYLEGRLVEKQPTAVVLDVNGIGYRVQIPLSSFSALAGAGANGRVRLFTSFHVREDSHQLFGFATQAEREMFELLLSVSGVGPKAALALLSGLALPTLRRAIAEQNTLTLESVSGVGKKLAARLTLELKDKIGKLSAITGDGALAQKPTDSQEEAVLALVSLGYTRPEANRKVEQVAKRKDLPVEEVVRQALQTAG